MKMKDYGAAKLEFMKAERLCTENGNQYKEADVKWLLGELYLELSDYGRAIDSFKNLWNFMQQINWKFEREI